MDEPSAVLKVVSPPKDHGSACILSPKPQRTGRRLSSPSILFGGKPLFYTFITLCHFFHSLSQQVLI
jgi:hypothetical protein